MKNTHLRRMAAALAILTALAAATACASDDAPDSSETYGPIAPVTLPDLKDDREPSSVVGYNERLETAFANKLPASAENFTYTVSDSAVTVTGYTGGDVVVVIPSEIDGMPVTALSGDAFAGKGSLRALSIPDTVAEIEVGALAGCESLTTLRTPLAAASGVIHFGSLFGAETYETNGAHVPSGLSTLILTAGDTVAPYAFYDCDLEAVALPETLTEIGEFAFYGNDKLAHIPLGKTALETVGEHAFTNCRTLLSMELPASVKSLGFAMLEGCGKLETLTVPFTGAGLIPTTDETEAETEDEESLSTDHLGYIFGAKAYVHSAGYLPASLITVTLLEGCGDIPANAFFECSSIREIILPEGVTSIGRRAFYGCAKLSNIALPDSVTGIGDDAFHGCIRLVDLTVGEGLTTLGVQAFMDCLSLRTVTLPAGVTHLSNSAFAGCRSLESFTAPGVVSQGDQVFRHCDKLTDVILAPVNA